MELNEIGNFGLTNRSILSVLAKAPAGSSFAAAVDKFGRQGLKNDTGLDDTSHSLKAPEDAGIPRPSTEFQGYPSHSDLILAVPPIRTSLLSCLS